MRGNNNSKFIDGCWYNPNITCPKNDVTYCMSPCITCEHNPENKFIINKDKK